MKKIEILYFEGCPNHQAAVDLVRDVARELGITVEIAEVEITSLEDAQRLRFLGSPTVRVDGEDIEPGARLSKEYAMACRTYTGGGLPPRSLLAAALASHRSETPGRSPVNGKANRTVGGVVAAAGLSALLASVCCLGPLLLAAVGASTIGMAALFAPARPYLLVMTVLFLGAGFYRSYFRKQTALASQSCATNGAGTQRLSRLLLWLSTGVIAAVALFPMYGGSLLRAGGGPSTTTPAGPSRTVTLDITGMTCTSCADHIEHALQELPGVGPARVSYSDSQAVITIDLAAQLSTADLVRVVEEAGYKATPRAENQ